jgi:hypothetical protein
LRVEVSIYVPRSGIGTVTDEGVTMSAVNSWALSILAVLGLVLLMNQLGVNATADLGTMLRGTEHLLSQPLFAL